MSVTQVLSQRKFLSFSLSPASVFLPTHLSHIFEAYKRKSMTVIFCLVCSSILFVHSMDLKILWDFTEWLNTNFTFKTYMSNIFVSWRIICWWESGKSLMAVVYLFIYFFFERAPQTKFQFISVWFQNCCVQCCLRPPKTEAQEEVYCLRILTSAWKRQKLRTWKQKMMRTQASSLIGTWS